MPVYVYKNLTTGATFELGQRITEDALTVDPASGEPVKRLVQPVGIAFKGAGFYVTDSRNKSGSRPAGAKGSDNAGSDNAGADSAGANNAGAEGKGASTSGDAGSGDGKGGGPKTDATKGSATSGDGASGGKAPRKSVSTPASGD